MADDGNEMQSSARNIVARLRGAGHIAYFAGGCVRDLLRGVGAKDIDIATDARPETVQKLVPRTYAVGAHFGVIVVLQDGCSSRSRRFVQTARTSMAGDRRR
jgi:poly(A) polymerase